MLGARIVSAAHAPAIVADRVVLSNVLADLRRLMSWCEHRQLVVAQQMARVSSFPEKDVADAARLDLGDGQRVVERAQLAATLPALADGLAYGQVAVEHLDIVGRALRDLDPGQRALLVGRAGLLVDAARRLTPGSSSRANCRSSQRGTASVKSAAVVSCWRST